MIYRGAILGGLVVATLGLFASLACAPHEVHFGYEGEAAPEFWDTLSPEWTTCKTGAAQSPIDLCSPEDAGLPPIAFHYAKAPLRVVNNGHSLQVDIPKGSYAHIDGQRYDLRQFHFHHLSEHTVRGAHYPMEAHLVHTNTQGDIAVVGVFFTEGAPSGLLGDVLDHAPQDAGCTFDVHTMTVDPAALLPAQPRYYRYTGSLTTPPCTEGVLWSVFEQPVEVSAEQIARFREMYPNNYRPVQPLNDRTIEAGG